MDSLVLRESAAAPPLGGDMNSKQWAFVQDQNNGSYNSPNIEINTTALSNSGAYVNWAESYLAIPLVITVSAQDPAHLPAGTPIDYWVGLKSGFWHILNSMTVEYNNSNAVQQQPFLNIFSSFKNLTSWSLDDLKNHGSTLGFYPDTADSWCYNNEADADVSAVSGNGVGISNNKNARKLSSIFTGVRLAPAAPGDMNAVAALVPAGAVSTYESEIFNANPDRGFNEGLRHRQKWMTYDAGNGLLNESNKHLLLSNTEATRVFKTTIENGAGFKIIRLVAKIHLGSICDFFNKLPMIKGATMKLSLTTNTALSMIDVQTHANGYKQRVAGQTILNQFNPLQLASIGSTATAQGGIALAAAAAATRHYAVAVSIVKNTFTKPHPDYAGWDQTHPLGSVRLYAPLYKMNPIAEQNYLSLVDKKTIIYNDFFTTTFNGVSSTNSFSYIVTNGIANLKSVLVIPFLNRESNGPAGVATNVSSLMSPFSASGAMPDPISISNFQVAISGQNTFQNELTYDYVQFAEQLRSSNQLNGNLTRGLTSGLISEYDFTSGYRYYYANVSRGNLSDEGVQKSVQISGYINAPANLKVDLYVFCEYEKKMTIDIRTGNRLE